MVYMGSKRRIAKDILPIILKDRKPGQWYVEPFVGGANMIDKVEDPRIGADYNDYVIEVLKIIRDNPESLPDHVSREEHKAVRENPDVRQKGVVAFIRVCCSFGSDWNGGFAANSKGTNYAKQAKNNAIAQSPNLKGILFQSTSYQYLDVPPNSIIYCDPPYEGTTGYKDVFNHSDFWEWVRQKSTEGHSVFVSEYNAPEDFICVWQQEQKTTLNNRTTESKKAIEKLFVFNELY